MHLLFFLIFKFPGTMGENIRIFHIKIIHLIGGNITMVIVVIFARKSRCELAGLYREARFFFLASEMVSSCINNVYILHSHITVRHQWKKILVDGMG